MGYGTVNPTLNLSDNMRRLVTPIMATAMLLGLGANAQDFPEQMALSSDGHRLTLGKEYIDGFYEDSVIQTVRFDFPQANYWTLMTQNYQSKTEIPATVTINGQVFDSVGIRFKGNTSYMNVQNSQKKSFNVSLDSWIDGQDIEGYNTLNFNNSYEDPSFLREVVYLHQIRKHIPASKGNFIRLNINGANWGLYPNVQQLNQDFYKEWFLSNDGTNWRADAPSTGGGGGGGGGQWGDGTAALNYLGADTALYKARYTLKSTKRANPWQDLVEVCDKLNNTPSANLEAVLNDYMDVDRTLWFLASEIAFCDDDSYIFKGKMDYYVYREAETGRTVPQEFDGNSAFYTQGVTSWGPFYNANKVNYPLLNKLLAVPALRQRYIAHMRTIIAEELDTASMNGTINWYKAMIDTVVQNDPKKIYTYAQFGTEVTALKNFVNTRRNYLLGNTEFTAVPPVVASASHSVSGVEWERPDAMQDVPVVTAVTSAGGISAVNLYYSANIVGKFTKLSMYDDGAHNDGASGDGTYGASIPGQAGGTWVRYYVEAVSNNAVKSVAYLPVGAEHDVFVYLTKPVHASDSSVVINEVMASNSAAAADNVGEYDDWIELYNRSAQTVDISGYILTDNDLNLDKFELPANTLLAPDSYLIIWADEDKSQGDFHANFKLSSSGEYLTLLNANREIVDEVTFTQQVTDSGYARVPNGTGAFKIQWQTFNANNSPVAIDTTEDTTATGIIELKNKVAMNLYPNPTNGKLHILLSGGDDNGTKVAITNMLGQPIEELNYEEHIIVSTDGWTDGVYLVRYGNITKRLVLQH